MTGTMTGTLDLNKILSLYLIGRSDVFYLWEGRKWGIECAWGVCTDRKTNKNAQPESEENGRYKERELTLESFGKVPPPGGGCRLAPGLMDWRETCVPAQPSKCLWAVTSCTETASQMRGARWGHKHQWGCDKEAKLALSPEIDMGIHPWKKKKEWHSWQRKQKTRKLNGLEERGTWGGGYKAWETRCLSSLGNFLDALITASYWENVHC